MPPLDKPLDPKASALAVELRVVLGRLLRRLRGEGGTSDLIWSQKAVLSHIERDGRATVSTLARLEGVRPQSMGATVAALDAAGLLQGAPDPRDGRQRPCCTDLPSGVRNRLGVGGSALT